MDKLFSNTHFGSGLSSNKDILSAFKTVAERQSTIQQGMTVHEISEVVSDRILAVIQEQFQAIQAVYEAEAKKS
ncbi:MAG: hypothetical protein SH808_09010 [Saprospiraceae bacterium]|nr:hypothetical protein [Saprospiraceae bacterium]